MEIAGLVFGVAGLAGLFEACSKLYDRVSSARSYLEDCEYLDTLFEIEKGRFASFKHEIQGMVNLLGEDFPPADNNKRPPQADVSGNTASNIEIEGDGRILLIRNILRLIERRLREAATLIAKYDTEFVSATQSSSGMKAKLFGRMPKKLLPVRWATGDKTTLSVIVQELHRLNDGLEKQLPQQSLPRLRLGFAANQILAAEPEELQSIQNASLQAGYGVLSKGAAVRLASLGQEMAVATGQKSTAPDSHIRLSDVKISEMLENSLRYLTGYMESTSTQVLIERRSAFKTTKLPDAAATRLNQLVHVLRSMHSKPQEVRWGSETDSRLMNFGVLHCIGWIAPENQDFEMIDLVFSYPPNTRGPPTSMHCYLRLRHENKLPQNLSVWNRPPLGARFKLALSLARLYANFISVGYLHRGINSHNILFFADNFHLPYLAGVAEARPDQILQQSSRPSIDYMDRELYWPWRTVIRESNSQPNADPWCTADDLYGLGVVLVEIGHWRTASHICGESSVQDFHQVVLPRAVEKLDYHMGDLYRDVVKRCFMAERDLHGLAMYEQYSATVLAQLERCSA